MTDQDTREKLEADLQALTESWHEYDGNYMRIYHLVAYAQIKELLDRQAAITEREICKRCEWPSLAALPDRSAYDRIAELEVDHDELLAMIDEKDELLGSATRNLDESLDDLKDMGEQLTDMESQRDELQKRIVELQSELDNRDMLERDSAYIRLPVDADGVQVKMGDMLHDNEHGYDFKVDGLKIWGNSTEWWAYLENGIQAPVHRCTHVKPRTIEDVLKEVMAETRLAVNPNHWIIEKYADELRELMGGDAS